MSYLNFFKLLLISLKNHESGSNLRLVYTLTLDVMMTDVPDLIRVLL